jgi:parallel beta-helix repeat protein
MINSRFLKLFSLIFCLSMPLFSPIQLQACPLSTSIISPLPLKQQTILNVTFPSFSYSPHDPIDITNDSTLASVAVSGTGTAVDPFILEGWNITVLGGGANGISISSTTKFFIIRNCWVKGYQSYSSNILIEDVQMGTVTIDSNVCLYSELGIEIFNTSKVTITNNLCTNHFNMGINLYRSNYTIIINNTCSFSDYGLRLVESNYLTIFNNTIVNSERGIALYYSFHSILNNNSCINNRFGIIIISSYINYYPSNVTLVNNSCNNNEIGLQIGGNGKSIIVINNSFNYNTEEGIAVVANFIDEEVNDCLIAWNEIIGNGGYGLYYILQGTNTIHHNLFLDNNGGKRQAYDDSKTNIWFDQVTEEGNWWGDYLGRGEYQLDGSSNARDPYPFFIDNDEDFMADPWEDKVGLNSSLDDSSEDPDGDLLLNIDEFLHNTDPFNSDTDGDGYSDYDEIRDDTDPLNKWSNAKTERIVSIILVIIYLILIILIVISTVFYRSRKKRIYKVRKDLEELRRQLFLWEGNIDLVQIQSEKTNLTEKQNKVINSNFSVLEEELKTQVKKYEKICSYIAQNRIINYFVKKEKEQVDDLIWQCLAKSGNKRSLLKEK